MGCNIEGKVDGWIIEGRKAARWLFDNLGDYPRKTGDTVNNQVVFLIFDWSRWLRHQRRLVMASENKRTIEVGNGAVLSFDFRMNKDELRENAKTVTVNADLSKLTAEDILEWAYSAMVVSFQSKLRSKNPPKPEEDGSYKWSVPSRGTRSTQDPTKVAEAADKILNKMDGEAKKELLYKTLVSMGKSAAEATAISGFAPVAKVTPATEDK